MINQKSPSLNALWSQMIVRELLRNRIDQFVLSPGSRCTPLTAAIAAETKAAAIMHFDERGAAYFAVGYGRATGRPAVLVCTSGTAAANYFPAVVEASMDMVPLILLTADRPPELLKTGANQTIEQAGLYGNYVRFHFDLPCPDQQIAPESVLTLIDQAVYLATRSPRGPVHINCMFREPLAPLPPQQDFSLYLAGTKQWLNKERPYTSYARTISAVADNAVQQHAAAMNNAKKGLLVVGRLDADSDREAIRQLASKLNWPVFADIRSGLRLGVKDIPVISYFDQLLLSEKVTAVQPSTVVHFGGPLISKRFDRFLNQNPPKYYIHVAGHPLRHDPNHVITARIECDIDLFCQKILPLLNTRRQHAYLKELRQADQAAGRMVERIIEDDSAITEPAVARMVSTHIFENDCLFLGNSMPIRDMDMYADPSGNKVKTVANRGASGIDGNIASAAGFVHGARTSGTAVIGDLAGLHDVNSLVLLNKISHPITVIVVNNAGGGIFSFLPVAACREIFEPYFATGHNLTFEKIAAAFKIDYYQPRSKDAFIHDYTAARNANRPAVIEIRTDRRKNLEYHQFLQDKIKTTIDTP